MKRHSIAPVAAVGTALTVFLFVASAASAAQNEKSIRKSPRMGDSETAVYEAMRSLAAAEERFKLARYQDQDGDGVGDYGTLAQLCNPDGQGSTPSLVNQELSIGHYRGYLFTVSVTCGAKGTKPGFSVLAVPEKSDVPSKLQYLVDESGVVRVTHDGSSISKKAKDILFDEIFDGDRDNLCMGSARKQAPNPGKARAWEQRGL